MLLETLATWTLLYINMEHKRCLNFFSLHVHIEELSLIQMLKKVPFKSLGLFEWLLFFLVLL